MTDPTGYLGTKLASMIGGFFGGATILTFIRPKTIGEAFMRGGTSVGSAMIFSSPLLSAIGWHTDWETQLMAGFCVGFVAYSILGMIANFLARKKDDHILDVVTDIKNSLTNNKNNEKTNQEK